jgi:hypothetical protein
MAAPNKFDWVSEDALDAYRDAVRAALLAEMQAAPPQERVSDEPQTTHWICACGATLTSRTAREHRCPDAQPARLGGTSN